MAGSQLPTQKIPKDGPGPRGLPDCYYTSRVLNSTFRYVKFVRKLRAEEEEARRGAENKLKELQDQQNSDFFIRCDRRSLINKVARRVDLCMKSYEQDLVKKRQRLINMLAAEEEENIRKLVIQAQSGTEQIWQEKQKRLAYLLEKRRKEHEEKYKDTPLSKCAHVLPCITKIRAKEAEQIQLYQMREKQAMKMAEIEMDKMWNAVVMKEAEALAARMEQDAIERYRRDMECKAYSDFQVEQNRLKREQEREKLKQETLWLRSIWEEDNRKAEEAEHQRREKSKQVLHDMEQMIEEKRIETEKQKAADQLITDTWDSLAGQGIEEIKTKEALRKRKEKELDECNKHLITLKQEMETLEVANDDLLEEEARRRQDHMDRKRCDYLNWSRKTNTEVRQAMVGQIKDRKEAREASQKKMEQQDEYERQLRRQLDQLVEHKEMTDAQARKRHQKNLLEQMEYNKLLKERARQEELDQIKKCNIAKQEYQDDIKRMLSRPFYSDEIHPFMKQMAKGLEMRRKCPCSKPDYCASDKKQSDT